MNIAIIDDQEDIRYAIEKILKKEGHNCYEFSGKEEDLVDGLNVFEIELVILDMMLAKNLTGLDVIKTLRDNGINVPIVMITAYTTPSNMIKASQFGIIDVIQKPFGKEDIIQTVNKYITNYLKKDVINLHYNKDEFVGSFETMKEVYKNIGIASKSDFNVLVLGETGTGKELVARLIHKNSKKLQDPFVAINCSSIPENLFEKLMYGRVENFSKNQNDANIGYIQKVGFGTLFLDDIDELHISLQPKLLRFLETKSFYPLGSANELKFEGRIICASSKTKDYLKNSSLFRNDLYYRVSTFEIFIPSLKDRKEDIKELVLHFIKKHCNELKIKEKSINDDAIVFFKEYGLEGNVRELKNIIYKIVLNSRNEIITLNDIQNNIIGNNQDDSLLFVKKICEQFFEKYGLEESKQLFEDFEREMLRFLAAKCNNYSKLANFLDMSRNTLKSKLKKYNIILD